VIFDFEGVMPLLGLPSMLPLDLGQVFSMNQTFLDRSILSQTADFEQSGLSIRQLQLLGYTEDATVYYRAIHTSKGARKIEGKGFTVPAALQQASDAGYNIYIVINGQGHTDAEVTSGRALFYEHDDLAKELQIGLWQSLGLPEPTFQVDTGGKSIHSYWVFDTPCPVADWKALQADLLEFADADRTIKNPSRVMRLAGFKHQKTGVVSQIISASGQRYSFDSLRQLVPEKSTPVGTVNNQNPSSVGILDAMPLQACLAPATREILRDGAGEGSRNDSGAKLARDLIGTASQLATMGMRFDGDPRYLFNQYCDRCTPPLDNREAETIWKSAENSAPGSSLDTDKIEGCIDAWRKRQERQASQVKGFGSQPTPKNRPAANRVVPLGQPEGEVKVSYEQAIRALADKGHLPHDELVFEQARIAKEHGVASIDVKTAYAAVTTSQSELEGQEEIKQNVVKYFDLAHAEIDLWALLPGSFVDCLEEISELLGTSPEVMLTTLLAAVASLCEIGTRLKLGRSNYYAKTILWSSTIVPSGGNKTGTQRTIISPLEAMQAEAFSAYKKEQRIWAREMKEWSQKDKKERGEPPEEPSPPRRFLVKRATKQAVIKIQCEQPNHGFLVYRDELSGWFNSMGEHVKGSSDDLDFWCELKNGDSLMDDTKSSGSGYCKASSVSITGATQPSTMQKLMGDFSDGQGLWARFVPCFVPWKRRARPSMAGREVSIFDWLKDAYERIADLLAVTYLMDPDAFEIWADYAEELKDLTQAESRDALRSVYSKAEAESGTMILLLHILNAVLQGEAPEPQIPLRVAKAGVMLSRFMIGQVHQLHRLGDEKRGAVDAVAYRVLQKAEELGGRITWRQARNLRALDQDTYGGNKPIGSKCIRFSPKLQKWDLA
jgi:hypothetical protein